MAKNRRKSAKKASSSMLMLLIIASAVLAFVPFRVTLAAGAADYSSLGLTPALVDQLMGLAGTHITIDTLGLFSDSNFLADVLTAAGQTGTTVAIFQSMDYLGVKVQRATVDITNSNQSAAWTPGYVTNPTPLFPAAGGTVLQLRLVLLSVTISGYTIGGTATNPRYNETSLVGLNPALVVSLDRVLVDLFIDPFQRITTYLVSADMTVYQGLALLLEASLL